MKAKYVYCGLLLALMSGCGKKDGLSSHQIEGTVGAQSAKPLGGDSSQCAFANLLLNEVSAPSVSRIEYSCKTSVGATWNLAFFADRTGYKVEGAKHEGFTFEYSAAECLPKASTDREFFRMTDPALENGQLKSVQLHIRDYSGSTNEYLVYPLSDCALSPITR